MLRASLLLALYSLLSFQLDGFSAVGTKAVVLFFVASDCPVSNRTFPEMKRLEERFTARGVSFIYVYPNANETASGVRLHHNAFAPEGKTVLDAHGALVHLTRVTVTPEVAIMVRSAAGPWAPVYVGRIDDRFVHIGQERPVATKHFAEAAMENILDGKAIAQDGGNPVGCTILTRTKE